MFLTHVSCFVAASFLHLLTPDYTAVYEVVSPPPTGDEQSQQEKLVNKGEEVLNTVCWGTHSVTLQCMYSILVHVCCESSFPTARYLV